MRKPEWKLEFYEEKGREPVLDFLRGLEEIKEQALAAALSNVLGAMRKRRASEDVD
jgi:hypothetical protein